MESYGTTANLNILDTITKDGISISNDFEKFFEFTQIHQASTWLILCGFIIMFSIIAGFVLRNINKESGK